jgi:hypothetical protein
MARGGISTFKHEEAETEWVLEVKVPLPQYKRTGHATKSNQNGSADPNGFSALAGRDEEGGASSSEEDIWTTTQPSGRQTFGSFRKGKSRTTSAQLNQTREGDDDEDLSSASNAGEHSDSDEESGAESSSDSHTARRHKIPPTSHGKSRANPTKDINSDEEMRQVRQAIEKKHRNMRGTAIDHPKAKQGMKRKGREQGSYKTRKKARKTI